jgi:hypothetical protein
MLDPPLITADATLSDMPLFLEPDRRLPVPLERTYRPAFEAVPRRWPSVCHCGTA